MPVNKNLIVLPVQIRVITITLKHATFWLEATEAAQKAASELQNL